tara:strand:+ start:643 stop:1155 length:513 start_codon:yes stop_codon:yes gene_type:complete
MDDIENKVAKSGLVTLELEELKPNWNIEGFDMKDVLWQGIALKEKDFREFVKTNDWSAFESKSIFIFLSVDAIIPTWAFMLLSASLTEYCETVVVGQKEDLELVLWRKLIDALNLNDYRDQRVIVKGCSDETIPETIYFELSSKLVSVVKSLMFGEPCSTVPIYKKNSPK